MLFSFYVLNTAFKDFLDILYGFGAEPYNERNCVKNAKDDTAFS